MGPDSHSRAQNFNRFPLNLVIFIKVLLAEFLSTVFCSVLYIFLESSLKCPRKDTSLIVKFAAFTSERRTHECPNICQTSPF